MSSVQGQDNMLFWQILGPHSSRCDAPLDLKEITHGIKKMSSVKYETYTNFLNIIVSGYYRLHELP